MLVFVLVARVPVAAVPVVVAFMPLAPVMVAVMLPAAVRVVAAVVAVHVPPLYVPVRSQLFQQRDQLRLLFVGQGAKQPAPVGVHARFLRLGGLRARLGQGDVDAAAVLRVLGARNQAAFLQLAQHFAERPRAHVHQLHQLVLGQAARLVQQQQQPALPAAAFRAVAQRVGEAVQVADQPLLRRGRLAWRIGACAARVKAVAVMRVMVVVVGHSGKGQPVDVATVMPVLAVLALERQNAGSGEFLPDGTAGGGQVALLAAAGANLGFLLHVGHSLQMIRYHTIMIHRVCSFVKVPN